MCFVIVSSGARDTKIFQNTADTGEDYATANAKLDQYFLPKKNVDYEIFQFRQAMQRPEETVDQFVTHLCKLVVHCEFTNLDQELRSAVNQHCKSKRLRRYVLRKGQLTLDKLLSNA